MYLFCREHQQHIESVRTEYKLLIDDIKQKHEETVGASTSEIEKAYNSELEQLKAQHQKVREIFLHQPVRKPFLFKHHQYKETTLSRLTKVEFALYVAYAKRPSV